jgi:hypothetical protein
MVPFFLQIYIIHFKTVDYHPALSLHYTIALRYYPQSQNNKGQRYIFHIDAHLLICKDCMFGYFPQHFLNFFPLPQEQGSFLPIFGSVRMGSVFHVTVGRSPKSSSDQSISTISSFHCLSFGWSISFITQLQ